MFLKKIQRFQIVILASFALMSGLCYGDSFSILAYVDIKEGKLDQATSLFLEHQKNLKANFKGIERFELYKAKDGQSRIYALETYASDKIHKKVGESKDFAAFVGKLKDLMSNPPVGYHMTLIKK